MTNKEIVLNTMKRQGKQMAAELQAKAADMTGTELNGEKAYIPSFLAACAKKNMLEREAGFVCRSSAGRVVKLLQPYDSAIYPGEPEELSTQWGFVWSQEPAHALPFMAISTSPFMIGDCCTEGDAVYRSTQDNNVWAPSEYTAGWELVTESK